MKALLAALIALVPGFGWASAWTQPPGAGFAAVTVAFTEAARRFDRDGDLVPDPGFSKWESRAYGEYGLAEGLTAVGQVTLQRKTLGAGGGARTGLEFAEAGLRGRLGQVAGGPVSVQGLLRLPGAWGSSDPAAQGATDPEADLRLLAGRSWAAWGAEGWADLQGAYRIRFGSEPDELRADLTLGWRATEALSLIGQGFATRAVEGRGADLKLQLSAVRALAPGWSVQVGAGAAVWGRDAAREVTGFAAVWRRF